MRLPKAMPECTKCGLRMRGEKYKTCFYCRYNYSRESYLKSGLKKYLKRVGKLKKCSCGTQIMSGREFCHYCMGRESEKTIRQEFLEMRSKGAA